MALVVLRPATQADVPMLQRWDDRYCLIGPYNPTTAAVDFEERPTEGIIRQTLDRLREAGIPCHFGRWLILSSPTSVLAGTNAFLFHVPITSDGGGIVPYVPDWAYLGVAVAGIAGAVLLTVRRFRGLTV